jgi:hypothetical protein
VKKAELILKANTVSVRANIELRALKPLQSGLKDLGVETFKKESEGR